MREVYAGATTSEGSAGLGEADRGLETTDPNANVPAVIIGLWVAAAIGFGAYFAAVYAPHLLASLR